MARPAPRLSRLVERDAELEQLTDAVDAAAAGHPGLILIEGPGGIGKTRLLRDAQAAAARAGVQILEARGSEREQRLPFGIVDQLFPQERPVRLELAGAGEGDESFATLAALHHATEALAARGPVMLVVDDLHLCDEPSLQFFGYLARRLGRLRASVLATLRPFERAETAALLSELAGDPLAISVRPTALSATGTAALLTEALGQAADEAFAVACRDATGGNPLLLTELVKTLRLETVEPVAEALSAVSELGPRAVLRSVLARLAGLPADAIALARAVAVLGESGDLAFAAGLAGLTPGEARVAASALIGAEILIDGARPAFVHPLVESAVYEDIPAPERSRAHEAAAELLRDHHAGASAIAAHLVLAPPAGRPWACDALAEAARASLRAGAPADAVECLKRALREPPPPGRRAEFTAASARATMLVDGPAAELQLREAIRLTDEPVARASLTIELARLLMFIDRVDESIPLLDRVAVDLPPDAGDLRRVLATVTLMVPLFDPTFSPSPDVVALGRRLPLEAGVGAKMLAAQSARHWAYDGGSADRCAELALAALDGGDLVRADSVFLAVSAVVVLELADRPEADAGWAAIRRECDLHGSHQARIALSLFQAHGLARRGELADADRALDAALEAFRDWNAVQGVIHAAAFRARVRLERGDFEGAHAALGSVPPQDRPTDEARLWLDSRVALLNAESRHDEALEAATELARRFAFIPAPIDSPALLHRAVALDGLGRRDEAVAAGEAALAQARTWGAPSAVAQALRVLGRATGGAAGVEHLRGAVGAVEGTRGRLQLAKAQVELGAALRTHGDIGEARAVLRAGLDLAAQLGTEALEARARRELLATGARPRTTALTGPGSLTEAERRVVERAASGDTNRQIGEVLFVTTKTVELHLSNAYRKLGVRGRRELASALDGVLEGDPD